MTTTTYDTASTTPTDSAPPVRSAWWRSPEHTWHTSGATRAVPAADAVAALEHTLRDTSGPVLGVLPFDRNGTATLVEPHPAADPVAPRPATPDSRIALHPIRVEECRSRYATAVGRALDLIAEGRFDKAVLARKLDLHADAPLDPVAIFDALVATYPSMYTFNTPLPTGGAFVGASPELLIAKRGKQIHSHPLAGSIPRSVDLQRDEEASRQLLASEKDNREHRYVVEAIADTLAPYCRNLTVPTRPALVSTRTVWHLGSYITGELRDDVSSLELARALHPTPAIGGTPRAAALEHIDRLEDFDRGYYAGAAGWCDASGDGEWAVAIRCAEIDGQLVRAYAGAGIVAGSLPESEVTETNHKLRAVLDVIGRVVR